MGDINYAPLIDEMVWSYSRIGCYDDCPYRWYLKYIRKCKDKDMFYASYGSFMHKLIEKFYRGEMTKSQMLTEYLTGFKENVKGKRPKASTVKKFIDGGAEYLRGFSAFPYKMLDVEHKVEFDIDGRKFLGFIDFLGEDDDGGLVIVDNKSRDLKPRSGREKPTVKDKELDGMLRQLYLYAIAVEKEFGKLPKGLAFNCYRTGQFIYEEFNNEAFEEAKAWAIDSIKRIREDSDFEPNPNVFTCFWICGVNGNCEYAEIPWNNRKR